MARPKPLADFIDVCLDKAWAAQGFAGSDVILSWSDIVGERLARVSQPIKMDWPRRLSSADRTARSEPAALVIRVEGAFAIEFQHLAPVIVERVNAHYGWRCVGRLVLKQGPVRRVHNGPPPERALTPEEQERLRAATVSVDEDQLRHALDRLGRAILASTRAADA